MRIESDLSPRLLRIKADLTGVSTVAAEKALRLTANDALAQVMHRVQQEGRGVAGQIISKASKKIDAYSAGHYKSRSKKGLQTGHIDLTFEGDLFRAWQVLSSNESEATIGFNEDKQADKAGYLEAYFGLIFGLTDDEKEFAVETFKEAIREYLNEKFV